MFNYSKSNLPPEAAVGINRKIVECEFCRTNFKLKCKIPERVQVKLISTKEKADYSGNYNPDLLRNKRANAKFKKIFQDDKN